MFACSTPDQPTTARPTQNTQTAHCHCAAVRGDLIRILHKLLKRKNKFDAILIETTGLADPAPVAQTFFVDDELKVWRQRRRCQHPPLQPAQSLP